MKLFLQRPFLLLLLLTVLSAKAQNYPDLLRTKTTPPKGFVLIIPDNVYKKNNKESDRTDIARLVTNAGYNAVLFTRSTRNESDPDGARDSALVQVLQLLNMLKTKHSVNDSNAYPMAVLGIGDGGHLAARLWLKLKEKERPGKLILVSPAYLNETISGTVIPALMPPLHPHAELLITGQQFNDSIMNNAREEYAKTWRGYGGGAIVKLAAGDNKSYSLQEVVKNFLDSAIVEKSETPNPATVATEGYARQRHQEKLELLKKQKYDLLFIGNSITNNFEKPEYQPVWQQFFAPRNALNLGYSGYRTENIIWNLQNGELDGQSPKVIILEIGTNNVDEKNYPTRHTASQLAGGIKEIVRLMRQKTPDAKIILLRCFPGSYSGPNPTSHRAILERASDMVSEIADNRHVFYCDVNHIFLNLDGSINHSLMPDWLHPSPTGAKAWAKAMEPLLSQLMGDNSLDTELSKNTAVVPVPKLEEDSYDWWGRHAEVLRIKDSVDPEIILIGNSITHFWGGQPLLRNADGEPRKPNGQQSWDNLFGKYRALNLGFGWDRTQNALWRLDHGEIDGLHPRIVIIDIGTNNTSQTPNARMNTAPEIVEGIKAVCGRVRSKIPGAKIILMAVFPREQSPLHPRRLLINEINKLLAPFAEDNQLTFIDIGPRLLAKDGTMLPGMTRDYTHPTEAGYQVWADAIQPFIDAP